MLYKGNFKIAQPSKRLPLKNSLLSALLDATKKRKKIVVYQGIENGYCEIINWIMTAFSDFTCRALLLNSSPGPVQRM